MVYLPTGSREMNTPLTLLYGVWHSIFHTLQYFGDIEEIEKIQKRATKLIIKFKHKPYKDWRDIGKIRHKLFNIY